MMPPLPPLRRSSKGSIISKKYFKTAAIIFLLIAISVTSAKATEEMQYKRFNLEDVSCDAGIRYEEARNGMNIAVSAIATGKGAEFRKWKVTDIRLNIAGDAVRPNKEEKFFVRRESLFRIPAAVIFAALGTQIDVGGSDLEQGITAAGMAVGLGLLVLQAHGDIAGEKCTFNIVKEISEKIEEGNDVAEIMVENEDLHEKYTVKIGLIKAPSKTIKHFDYNKMNQNDLVRIMDSLEVNVRKLEEDQAAYKYGVDPEYDRIQREIEDLEAQRGFAYKAWFEKNNRQRS